jgi:hypothetical protein
VTSDGPKTTVTTLSEAEVDLVGKLEDQVRRCFQHGNAIYIAHISDHPGIREAVWYALAARAEQAGWSARIDGPAVKITPRDEA